MWVVLSPLVGSAVKRGSPRLEPDVPSRHQTLLDVANTVAETLSPECFPFPPPMATVPRGFQSYGLLSQMSAARPTLARNPGQAISLAALDETFRLGTSLLLAQVLISRVCISGTAAYPMV